MERDGSAIASKLSEIEVLLHQYFCIENAAVFDAAHTFEIQQPRYQLEEVAFDPQGECYIVRFRYCEKSCAAVIPVMPIEPFTQFREWLGLHLRKAIKQAIQEY